MDGEVPSLGQFTAQHSRADADSAVWAFMSAALQQSISPIAPPMLHDCSLECRGVPAKAPPAKTNKSTSDMSLVLMAISHCIENSECLSRSCLLAASRKYRVAGNYSEVGMRGYRMRFRGAECGCYSSYKGDLLGILRARRLNRATMPNNKKDLFWASLVTQ